MVKVGISSCVVGQKVRFDGGHKGSNFVRVHLAKVFELTPICPEVGMGMSVPRPTIHLRDGVDGIKLTDTKTGELNHTDALNQFFDKVSPQVPEFDGYILAAKSPTCGMDRIKVYNDAGELQHRKGRGMYAQKLLAAFPSLPVEEDGRLNDHGLRESFIVRVFAHNEYRNKVLADPSINALIKFHSRYKFLVLAFHPQSYKSLGRLVAAASSYELDTLLKEYLTLLMFALNRTASRRKHTNVLMHLQGFFKKNLPPVDKQELNEQILKYRSGHVPLMAPLTLLKHHLKHFPNDYLQEQAYFQPYPEELGLRA